MKSTDGKINRFQYLIAVLSVLIAGLLAPRCEDDYLTINAFEAEGVNIGYELADTTSTLRVAVVAMTCSEQKGENLTKIKSFIDEIMQTYPHTELICFGETITGWYAEKPEYISAIAEPIPGAVTDSLVLLADRHDVHISFGMAEQEGNRFYNSLVVINPEGEIIGVHRKNTLTSEDEAAGYSPVKNAQIVSIKDFNLGLMICADVNGAWLTRQYIDAGIDIILSAFASPIGLPNFNIISRRLNAWQIFPNRNGKEGDSEYSGLIYVSDPAGNICKHRINEETYFTYTIAK